jgi:long-chain acyl-CoA synthetase
LSPGSRPTTVDRRVGWMTMRVEQFLSDSATRFGKKAAIVAAGRPHSYAELARISDRVAGALIANGVRRGDRVALFMDDNFEAVVSAFAVLKAGAVATPIAAGSDAAALALVLAATNPAAIITEARLASRAAAAMKSVRGIGLVLLCGGDRSTAGRSCLIFEEVARGIGPGPTVQRAGPASDPALLITAEGPEGIPVEAALTHAEVIAAAETCPADRGHRALSSVLTYHGVCQLLAAIRAGSTLVLETSSVVRRAMFAEASSEDGVVPALAG